MLAGGGITFRWFQVKCDAETDRCLVWAEPKKKFNLNRPVFIKTGVNGQKRQHKHIAQGPQVNTSSQVYVTVTQLQNLSWKGGEVH